MAESQQQSVDARIWKVVGAIPKGQVMSYGAVARAAGLGRAARRVSPALKRAPDKLQLPWQRVVGANGRIAFPPDSPGYQRQRELLEAEGVVFQGRHIAGGYLLSGTPPDADHGTGLDASLWQLGKG